MDGALVIDKPAGITSHDVVAAARRLLREKRIGHAGTLDPLATGVLVLVCGQATRLARFLSSAHKTYEAAIRFGITTDTCDITGTVTMQSQRRPAAEAVVRAATSLTGTYLQMPPAFSARKVDGQRAYDLARRRQPVALMPSEVTVSALEILEVTADRVRLSLTCSAGFYVRSFAQSLGEALECGATLEALRRTASGSFDLTAAVGLDVLSAAAPDDVPIIPPERMLPWMRKAVVTAEGRERVAHGRELTAVHIVEWMASGDGPGSAAAPDWSQLVDADGRLLAVAQTAANGALHPSVVLI